jgi:hypothetical protein
MIARLEGETSRRSLWHYRRQVDRFPPLLGQTKAQPSRHCIQYLGRQMEEETIFNWSIDALELLLHPVIPHCFPYQTSRPYLLARPKNVMSPFPIL